MYIVNVGNIGNIQCDNIQEADATFEEYVQQSKSEKGRAGGEDVYLFHNSEIIREYIPAHN